MINRPATIRGGENDSSAILVNKNAEPHITTKARRANQSLNLGRVIDVFTNG